MQKETRIKIGNEEYIQIMPKEIIESYKRIILNLYSLYTFLTDAEVVNKANNKDNATDTLEAINRLNDIMIAYKFDYEVTDVKNVKDYIHNPDYRKYFK